MISKSITHVIIPAAGFGKRVGKKISKELLYYQNDRFRLIEWALNLAKSHKFKPFVISRIDKSDLNNYLEENYPEIHIMKILESEEWTHTMQLSETLWGDKNILILPDTRFEPENIIDKISLELDRVDICMGSFSIEDVSQWGIVQKKEKEYYIAEKPKNILNDNSYNLEEDVFAWGVLGFRKSVGASLFKILRESSKDHQFKKIPKSKIEIIKLNSFVDIARIPKNLYETLKY